MAPNRPRGQEQGGDRQRHDDEPAAAGIVNTGEAMAGPSRRSTTRSPGRARDGRRRPARGSGGPAPTAPKMAWYPMPRAMTCEPFTHFRGTLRKLTGLRRVLDRSHRPQSPRVHYGRRPTAVCQETAVCRGWKRRREEPRSRRHILDSVQRGWPSLEPVHRRVPPRRALQEPLPPRAPGSLPRIVSRPRVDADLPARDDGRVLAALLAALEDGVDRALPALRHHGADHAGWSSRARSRWRRRACSGSRTS